MDLESCWRSGAGGGAVSVGVVGAGSITEMAHLPILSNIPDADISYVADIDAGRARRLAREYGTDHVDVSDPADLPRTDALLLAIPVGVRDDYYEMIRDRNRDLAVFSEKPFATTTAEHERWSDSATRILCNYMRTEYSSTRQLGRIVEEGLFGAVESITITESYVGATGIPTDHYRTNTDLSGGGVLAERGGHTLSQLVHLLDEGTLSLEDCTFVTDDGLDVAVDAALTATASGKEVDISYRITRLDRIETALAMECADATVRVDHTDADTRLSVLPPEEQQPAFELAPDGEWATSWSQAIYLRWRRFLDGAGEKTDRDRETGYPVTALIERMYEDGTVRRRIDA
ncbi:Gfo/Idh/MocA family protein [Haloplanus pelagicus]|uniref:Gfo/Idh/MocA family protein n=1 Tax=Haloplanus pelagicus TaxID=2949995 RepID=UPI00203C2C4B|nr:Gfo/Idh/MocA family oxidoreductase [Haloplanus sp. HW8-1]